MILQVSDSSQQFSIAKAPVFISCLKGETQLLNIYQRMHLIRSSFEFEHIVLNAFEGFSCDSSWLRIPVYLLSYPLKQSVHALIRFRTCGDKTSTDPTFSTIILEFSRRKRHLTNINTRRYQYSAAPALLLMHKLLEPVIHTCKCIRA